MLRHVIAFGGAARAAALRVARHRRTSAVVAGFAVGVAGWSAAHPFVASFGFERATVAGLLLAAAGAFAAGLRSSRRGAVADANGLPALFAAAWLVLLPAVLSAAGSVVAAVPVSWLAIDAVRVPALTAAGLIAFGLPAFCVGLTADRHRRRGDATALLVAAGLGVAANALVVAPFAGLHAPLLAVSAVTAIGWFVSLVRGTAPREMSAAEPAPSPGRAVALSAAASAALVGAAGGVSGRVLSQLMLESGYLVAGGVAAFLGGAAVGSVLAGRLFGRTGDDAAARRLGAALAACGVLLPLAAFPWLLERHLDANAFVSSVFWLMAIRLGTVAAVALPLGAGCGLMTARSGRVGVVACSLGLGLTAAAWLAPAFGVVPTAVAIGFGLIGTNLGPVRSVRPRTRIGWAAAAAGVSLVAVTAAGVGRYEPARAARLLFSTEAFLARQGGMPSELLPHLDDTRLVAASEGPNGTVTVWRQRGEVSLIRVDGVPVATASRRPDRCPLPSADVMRVALPLVLHQDPESVLVLGDPAGVATRVATGFPVRGIVCYDGTGRAESSAEAVASADDRVTFAALEPRVAVAAERRRFDVVVSDPGTPSALPAAPCFTREFYAAAAARLTDDGIFCQRLRYADFGPEPLRVLAATVRGVFGEAMTIEIGSGEYALVGVRPGRAVVRDGLVGRLKRRHVRRTLASLGWDWCVPLNLLTVEQAGLTALAGEASGVNTAANGRFACTLPQETMRWGPKWRDLNRATVGRTSRLIARGVSAADQEEVLNRIAEVTGQHRLMTAFPDQPWAYRKEIKTKLKESPRSVIRPVAGEVVRERHPDDRRRLDYFEALGAALRETTPQTLAAVERFAEPYDPMLSYFLHHEIAPLYAELGAAGLAGEVAHRLHAAYYADPRDRSVRDVAAALELLVARPEAVPGDADRFDHLNGLIEVLLGRWEARGMAEPRSPEVVMVDIDKSLDAAEAAVRAMGPLAPAAGLSDEDWRLRKAAIERTLTRPLRNYRTALLPHLREAQRKAAEAETKAETAAAAAE